jgi:Family of unknown function (DUF6165)
MPNLKRHSREIRAPIAIAELIDKITILEIKAERIHDRKKRRHIQTELKVLNAIKKKAGLDQPAMAPFAEELKSLNVALWDSEDAIRKLESRKDFGARFIELARNVYHTNDRRARLKHRVNATFGSKIVEEKSYKGS